MEDQITLEYRGPKVDRGEMDAYETAASILAFSDFMGVLSRISYGERAQLQTAVKGFRSGSFSIEFALHIAGITATLVTTGVSPKDAINILKDCFSAWKHLQGKPPKSLQAQNQNDLIQVENQNGQLNYYSADVINIITNPKAGEAVERFAKKPLESGIKRLRIHSVTHNEVVEVDEADASALVPVAVDQPLFETEMKAGLIVESPTFKDGNKWRFYDGQNSFHADIVDEEFLAKVDNGAERFGKGDILIVNMRVTQMRNLATLKTERTIIKVLEHKISAQQIDIFGA